MESKDLKHMSREDLLQMLIQLTMENEELQKQLASKEEEIVHLRRRPIPRETVSVKEPGSIAQAALEINHVFESAQRAANQYLENIARMQREQAIRCQRLISEAKAEAERIVYQAQQHAKPTEAQPFSYQWEEFPTQTNQSASADSDSPSPADHKKRNWHR